MAFVVEGFNPKKAVTVISEYNRQISSDIYQATGRGSTLLSGKGAYQQTIQMYYTLLFHKVRLVL